MCLARLAPAWGLWSLALPAPLSLQSSKLSRASLTGTQVEGKKESGRQRGDSCRLNLTEANMAGLLQIACNTKLNFRVESKEWLWIVWRAEQYLIHGGDEKSRAVARIKLWNDTSLSCPWALPLSSVHVPIISTRRMANNLLDSLPGPSSAPPTVTRVLGSGEMITKCHSDHSFPFWSPAKDSHPRDGIWIHTPSHEDLMTCPLSDSRHPHLPTLPCHRHRRDKVQAQHTSPWATLCLQWLPTPPLCLPPHAQLSSHLATVH